MGFFEVSEEESQEKRVLVFLQTLFNLMGVEAIPKVVGEDEEGVRVDIQGENLGIIIGKHGLTLLALQYLTNVIVNRGIPGGVRFILDAEGYRARRERSLRQMAERLAEQVVKEKKDVTIEDLPSHERRIVHMALRDHPNVITYSEGEGEERKLVISLREPIEEI